MFRAYTGLFLIFRKFRIKGNEPELPKNLSLRTGFRICGKTTGKFWAEKSKIFGAEEIDLVSELYIFFLCILIWIFLDHAFFSEKFVGRFSITPAGPRRWRGSEKYKVISPDFLWEVLFYSGNDFSRPKILKVTKFYLGKIFTSKKFRFKIFISMLVSSIPEIKKEFRHGCFFWRRNTFRNKYLSF